MAVRLIGTDSEDPRLPDVVVAATVGPGADDLASGDTLTLANSHSDAMYAALEARVALLEAGFPYVPLDDTLTVANCMHMLTSSEAVLTVEGSGEWTLAPANATHAHTAEEVTLLPEGPVELKIATGSTSFTPWVVLQSGSTATVNWYNSTDTLIATGGKPTIARPTDGVVRMLVTDGGLPAMNEVDYLNLGFNSQDDPGEFNIGPAYNHPGQPVTEIAGLQLLTGMRYFMAASTPLTSFLNCTGMNNLEHIECFDALITGVDMTGCTSLIRLCVESCNILSLDFSPVKNNLRDLRCARNASGAVAFSCDGPMTDLYHYCVPDQTVNPHVPNAYLPAVTQYWAWNTGIRTIDPPTSPILTSCLMGNPFMTPETSDAIIIALAALGATNGTLELGTPPPTHASDAARATLASRGWGLIGVPAALDIGTYSPPTHGLWVAGDLIALGTSPNVTGGALTVANGGYGRTIMRPGGRNAGPVYFEIQTDRTELDGSVGTSYWAMIVNCDASGNGGVKVMIRWDAVNPTSFAGVYFGASNTWDSNYPDGGNSLRLNPNPPGWTNPGPHTVGLYHGGNVAFVTLDGVVVYRTHNPGVAGSYAGGYVGVGGDPGGTNRIFQSWGISPVTMP